MAREQIQPIDLLVVNLYPSPPPLRARRDQGGRIENIDVGGPACCAVRRRIMPM